MTDAFTAPSREGYVPDSERTVSRFHLRLGWWAVFVFIAMGIALETMHGLKLGYYLDLANATRRHMWTLAHAHGTLLGLINIGFALSLKSLGETDLEEGWQRRASIAMLVATLMIPSGFALGGLIVFGGDPGLNVMLVPLGGFALLYAVWLTARRF